MNPAVFEENTLRAFKDLPSSEQEKVDAFNEKVKPVIEGVKGIQV